LCQTGTWCTRATRLVARREPCELLLKMIPLNCHRALASRQQGLLVLASAPNDLLHKVWEYPLLNSCHVVVFTKSGRATR
jgi:hypothetical protein